MVVQRVWHVILIIAVAMASTVRVSAQDVPANEHLSEYLIASPTDSRTMWPDGKAVHQGYSEFCGWVQRQGRPYRVSPTYSPGTIIIWRAGRLLADHNNPADIVGGVGLMVCNSISGGHYYEFVDADYIIPISQRFLLIRYGNPDEEAESTWHLWDSELSQFKQQVEIESSSSSSTTPYSPGAMIANRYFLSIRNAQVIVEDFVGDDDAYEIKLEESVRPVAVWPVLADSAALIEVSKIDGASGPGCELYLWRAGQRPQRILGSCRVRLFGQGNEYMIAESRDGESRCYLLSWDPDTQPSIRPIAVGSKGAPISVSPDSKYLVSFTIGKSLRVTCIVTKLPSELEEHAEVAAVVTGGLLDHVWVPSQIGRPASVVAIEQPAVP